MGNDAAKMNYYALLAESDQEEYKNCKVGLVGAGLSGRSYHTSELHVMKYEEVIDEHDSLAWKYKVLKLNSRYQKAVNW